MRTFQSTDSTHRQHNGQEVVATSLVPEELYDRTDVGPMLYATLANGVTVMAFADEIREA